MNTGTKQKQTQRYREQTCGCQGGGGVGEGRIGNLGLQVQTTELAKTFIRGFP